MWGISLVEKIKNKRKKINMWEENYINLTDEDFNGELRLKSS